MGEPLVHARPPRRAVVTASSKPAGSGRYTPATVAGSGAPSDVGSSPVARLQPRTVAQVLDSTFEVLRFRFVTLAQVTAVLGIPLVTLPTVASMWFAKGQGLSVSGRDGPFAMAAHLLTVDSSIEVLVVASIAAGVSFASMLMGVAVTRLVMGWTVLEDPDTVTLLAHTWKRLPVAVGAWLSTIPMKAVAAAACWVPLVVVIPVLSALGPVVAMEGLGPWRSLRRAAHLGRRRFGAFLGTCLSAALVGQLVVWVVGWLAWRIADTLRPGTATIAFAAAASLTWLVTMTGQVVATALLYLDSRVRLEGYDLEIEANERFGSPDPVATGAGVPMRGRSGAN
ncbi:MAG: hypothetical protein R2698_14390 [Microthrixaceae bacterium]